MILRSSVPRLLLVLVGLVAVIKADRRHQPMPLLSSSSRRLGFITPTSTNTATIPATTPATTSPSPCQHHHHHGSCPSSSQRRHLSQRRMAFDPSTIMTALGESPLPEDAVTDQQLLVGFVAGVFPFVWAAYEFWKRIDTQQRCGVCQGSGLVMENRMGRALKYPQKCYACGGFLPWQGWRRFWLSNLDIGNGGILQRPAADYDELSAEAKRRRGEDAGTPKR